MMNPRVQARVLTPVGGEMDTADLQGVGLYRGKEIKKTQFDDNIEFGIYDEGDDREGKSASSSKVELKSASQKKEKNAFEDQQESLPDFDDFFNSPDFQKFMAQIRRSQRGGSYDEIKQTLDSLFNDPTLKSAALKGAIKILESQLDDPALKELLEQVLNDLNNSNGAEIRAGYNVSHVAASTVGDEADLVAQLRDFYCQVVFGDQNLVTNYHIIMNSFPELDKVKRNQKNKKNNQGKEEPDGQEGQERLEKALEFLLKSLAAELKSNAPSLEPSFLKTVMDGLCQMEFFRNAYRSFLQMLTKMNITNPVIPVKPSLLINEILTRVSKDSLNDDEFLRIAEKFSVPPLQLSIEFLTRIYEMIRLFPERIFPSNANRENCLRAVQCSLDSAIARESEVA
ncbi:MAG: TyeA family type III secretion system gatekeeper subunit [Chthoniobacterales bacterium]|nr:TyeA family type III secretion system gatekeeper subunit [Chthoniobacterales bacterium]